MIEKDTSLIAFQMTVINVTALGVLVILMSVLHVQMHFIFVSIFDHDCLWCNLVS